MLGLKSHHDDGRDAVHFYGNVVVGDVGEN